MASDNQISTVWLDSREGEGPARAAIQYSTGIEVRTELDTIQVAASPSPGEFGEEFGEQSDDSAKTFDQRVQDIANYAAAHSDIPLAEWTATVQGHLAYTTPYVPGVHPGSIEFLFDDVRITIYGNVPKSTLVAIAETVT
jgi:hypothetical protein